jgi:hypothetical protein
MEMGAWSRVVEASLTRRRALILAGLLAGPALLAGLPRRAHAGSSPQTLAQTANELRVDVPDPSIPVMGESISPSDTDSQIDIALEPHYVALSQVPARGQLFLFLSGTGAIPARSFLLDQAARNGFHALNLRYPNEDVQTTCGLSTDTTCFENARLEILYGADRSSVNRANSVENRVLKLLAYLDATHQDQGWGAYLDGDALNWSSIVVAGASVGGGYAPLIARDQLVSRVAMLSAPIDKFLPLQGSQVSPAPWLLGEHVTPSERYFAFGHINDEGTNWALQWPATNLGLTDFGPIANVDEATPPYGGSHMLLTGAPPRDNPNAPAVRAGLRNHSSITSDVLTPLTDAGQPLFAPVWQYVCFA